MELHIYQHSRSLYRWSICSMHIAIAASMHFWYMKADIYVEEAMAFKLATGGVKQMRGT